MNSVWTDRYPSEYGWSLYGTEQTQNASEIASYLIGTKDVNVTSAYAILGNLTTESFLNPAQWQYHGGMNPDDSFGLAQWDPSTKLSQYLSSQGITPNQANMSNGYYQLDYLVSNSGQWSLYYVDPNTGYSSYYDLTIPVYHSLDEFLQDTGTDLEAKVKAWMVCWERPSAQFQHLDTRIQYAYHWAGETPPVVTIPKWLLFKFNQERRC